jgi:hypothetical protein
MTDFAKLAREAREKLEAEKLEKARALQEKADAETSRLASAKAALLEEVMPRLQEAKEAFLLEGITAVIDEHESFSNHTHKKIWQISFKCCKNGEPNTSRSRIATCGVRVKFEHDGSKLTITKDAASYAYSTLPTIDSAVVYALESYFAEEKKNA